MVFGALISCLDVRQDGFTDDRTQGRRRRPREEREKSFKETRQLAFSILSDGNMDSSTQKT